LIEGIITDKSLLPIIRINYGATIYPLSFSQYTVGRFECSGHSSADISKLPTSCEDLSQLGHILNGFYPIKQVNGRKIKMVYCDFNQTSVQEISGFNTENEFVQLKSAMHELKMQVITDSTIKRLLRLLKLRIALPV
jgi:hypothetical protein